MTLEKQELDRIETAKAAIGTAIAGKGVAVPSGTKLDGMAALVDGIEQGGGGEDVSAETAEYTSLLTDLETAIDALPEAGSGGGSGSGGSVETCTVTIMPTQAPAMLIYRSYLLADGKISYGAAANAMPGAGVSFECVCNTMIKFETPVQASDFQTENAALLATLGNADTGMTVYIFGIDAGAGETATITIQ